MKIVACEQYSLEWWEAKRGVPSASGADKIITPKTVALSASAKDYACELIAQRLTAGPYWLNDSNRQSQAMLNGSISEQEARDFVALERGCDVQQVGLITTDDGRFACSPDGLLENRGLEIKCPTPKVHVRYLVDSVLPSDYRPQVHFSLVVSGFEEWEFVSYCPGFDPLPVTVRRDEYTDAVHDAMERFWTLYQEILAKVLRPPTARPTSNENYEAITGEPLPW